VPTPEAARRPAGLPGALALVAAGQLAGCAALRDASLPAPNGASAAAVAPVLPPPVRPAAAPTTSELAAFYARIETERRARGLMRTDDGRRDGPISAGRLAAIWTEVALRDEVTGASIPLRRFEGPVAIRVEFGASVPAVMRNADRARLTMLAADLAEATGRPISMVPAGMAGGNFHVLVLSEAERLAIGPRLAELVPGIDAGAIALVEGMARETFCLALSFARGGGAVLTEAVAVVRAEHPDLTRLACYHEEIAQGLGLNADTPRARPSVFNDDQEFALLTHLDRLLLRLHHDPRLRAGMSEREAAPIVLGIASALAAGES
jgi:hypothetical protein